MKKYYTFKSVAIIEAENEEEARLDFADNSFDFAANADCYAFSIDKAGKKHLDGTISKGNDFSGGWDWSKNIIDTKAEYIYMLDGSGVYKI